ncbi:lasso peptide biosynthesis B2 protein [Rhizobium lusitanum]|uniref:lasso peptide biosynthesis B2 protein n=1 Tax=Rhizobium lusitanum TaxID=293958 RepID=UPI0039181496
MKPNWRTICAANLCVLCSFVLARFRPRRLIKALEILRVGCRAATPEEVAAARNAIVYVSTTCAGEGCLPRSIATAMLCRIHGVWPVWRAGARQEPFEAHAWVEADGVPIGENFKSGYFTVMMEVSPEAAHSSHLR